MSPPGQRARVSIFVFDLSATGVVRNTLALAKALAVDHDVEVVACRAGAMAQDGSFPVVILGGGARIGPLALIGLGWRLRRHIAASAPHIVISAGNRGHPLFLVALRGLRGLRRIYRFSNDIDHSRGGRGPSVFKRLGDGLQIAALLNDANRIVLVSGHLLADPRLAAGHASEQVLVIENGVDVARVRSLATASCDHPFARPGAPPFVLAIGRFTTQKNFPTIVEAVAIANRTRPVNLVILGAASDIERDSIESLAARLDIADRIALPGVIANPFAWLSRAAVFALPSWWEGSSNALLEALACGAPIIASTTAGNAADVLDDGRYGLLVDPGDVPAWAAALLRQAGPEAIRPGDRVDAYRIERTLSAWRDLIAAELKVCAAPPR